MNYLVEFTPHVERQLAKLDSEVSDKLIRAALQLGENPRPTGCKKLRGLPGYRIRVGKYRILYEVEDRIRIVLVTAAGPRKDIY